MSLSDVLKKMQEDAASVGSNRAQYGGTPEQAVSATHQPAEAPASNVLPDGTYASVYREMPKK